MFRQLIWGSVFLGLTVVVHAAGLVIALRPIVRSAERAGVRFWPVTWLVIRTVWWLIVSRIYAARAKIGDA